ncbi:16S rRNA (uracil(1498)-N(3))-methyltransferase [Methyloversatilis thermotolerans]|uniref:16S rRNA (uracil(1498)-N(3))-methyltransferase n=1 Tax=Methyloversatilis thermotolerans TaxID=1346290 RepID=UPI00036161EF|nr:16S rRNA (uracil(1498)-N(3))-methyltransferase [Methyloversatilis thermotolerans]
MIPRFHCPLPDHPLGRLALPGAVAHHVERVLRLEEGDLVTLFDGRGSEFSARLIRDGRNLAADVLAESTPEREGPLDVTLLQCLAASDKMDWIVQKAVELGVVRVQPVASRRAVLRLAGERADKRVAHWRQIAVSACEQCGRNRVPEIMPVTSLPQAVARESSPQRFILHPAGGVRLVDASPDRHRPIALLIGPEGGFDDDELAAASASGFCPLTLGPRVLRTETAGMAALAALNTLIGDF